MKSTFTPKSDNSRRYPWVGSWGTLVVLFTSPDAGVLLATTREYSLNQCNIGKYYTNFTESLYEPVEGTVTFEVP